MKRTFVFIMPVMVLLFGMNACKKSNNEPAGPADPTEKAKYTVLIYANGGENLEDSEERDIAGAAEFLATKKEDLSVRRGLCLPTGLHQFREQGSHSIPLLARQMDRGSFGCCDV